MIEAIRSQKAWEKRNLEIRIEHDARLKGKSHDGVARGQYVNIWPLVEPFAREKPRFYDEVIEEMFKYCGRRPSSSTISNWAERMGISLMFRPRPRERISRVLAEELLALPSMTERIGRCKELGVEMDEKALRNILKEYMRRKRARIERGKP